MSDKEKTLWEIKRDGAETQFQAWLVESRWDENDFCETLGITHPRFRKLLVNPDRYLTVRMIDLLAFMLDKTSTEIFNLVRFRHRSPTTARNYDELNLLIAKENELHTRNKKGSDRV